jgi:hypothetical protein
MDGVQRNVLVGDPVRILLVACALVMAISAGTLLGGSAQEAATPGASPEASPDASPEASPVAEPATETGSITIRVLGCDPGTTADSVGPMACSEVTADLDIALAGSDEPVTTDDALRLSAGVFRWLRLPYDTYSVGFATLPDGFTSALLAADATAAPAEIGDDGYEVTLDSEEPSPTITIYLIP